MEYNSSSFNAQDSGNDDVGDLEEISEESGIGHNGYILG